MKKRIVLILISILMCSCLLDALNLEEIVKKSDELLRADSVTGDIEISIYKSDEITETSKMQIYAKGRDKLLLLYYYPEKNKDRAVLKNEEGTWLYIPTNKRFLKGGSGQQIGKSNFNYGDIIDIRLADNYNPKILEENNNYNGNICYKIELIAKEKSVQYAKIICYIRKSDYAPIRREFYTSSGKMLKELVFEDINNSKPFKYVMKNALDITEVSIMLMSNIRENVVLDDAMFQKAFLERRK